MILGMNYRNLLALAHDVAACALAWFLAYWLRFNLDIPQPYFRGMLQTMALAAPLQAVIFWQFGLYRGVWRYASLADLKRILLAVLVAAVAAPALLFALRIDAPLPRSVLLLDPLLLVLIMGGSRVAYRSWKEHRLYGIGAAARTPVLVLGAGDAADTLVKDLERNRQWRVVGLLDDSAGRQGRMIQGIKVLGRIDELPQVAQRLSVQHAIVAMPSASHSARRRAVDLATSAGVKVLTVPSFDDLISGRVTVSALRQVELDDLLGRDPVSLDSAGLAGLINGRVVLVSGAGGSIGAELCRQVARFGPGRLVLLEISEYALYQAEQALRREFPQVDLVPLVGDVKDAVRVEQVLGRWRPRLVVHAAAYKHVPLMEQDNAWEAVRNNVLGTWVLGEAARRCGAERFVLVSTDKAVNPTNVMGASKRLAEMVCQALQAASDTRYLMVRFGNVLGSTGSVIPLFREQIARGGPVTVTHPEVTRYFMSIPEAAQLVLQAGVMGDGGEIFVLDMGEPVKIMDLARTMIRLSGLSEDEVRIEITGLRPGEKLYEELLADGERTLPTPHPKLRIAQARAVEPAAFAELLAWLRQAGPLDEAEVKRGLARWVPEYVPGLPRAKPATAKRDAA